MIGMDFWGFLVLLAAGVIAASVVHYGLRYRFLGGFDGFLVKVIVGWAGASLGSPLLGSWFERLKLFNIYLIPALLGAFVGAFIVTATGKGLAKAFAPRVASETETHEVRRAA